MSLIRWTLTDTVTAAVWTFPINPNTMGSPFNQKQLTTTPTVSGVPVTERAVPEPFEWTFGGHSRGKTMYDALVDWMGRGHVLVVSDHLAREFTILPTGVYFTERKSATEAWRFTYEVKSLMTEQYDGGIW